MAYKRFKIFWCLICVADPFSFCHRSLSEPTISSPLSLSLRTRVRQRSAPYPSWTESRRSTCRWYRLDTRCAVLQTTQPRILRTSRVSTWLSLFRTCQHRRTWCPWLVQRCRACRNTWTSSLHPTSCSKMSCAGQSRPTLITEASNSSWEKLRSREHKPFVD